LEEGMQTFQLAELRAVYLKWLQEFDVSGVTNKTQLKNSILNHFLSTTFKLKLLETTQLLSSLKISW